MYHFLTLARLKEFRELPSKVEELLKRVEQSFFIVFCRLSKRKWIVDEERLDFRSLANKLKTSLGEFNEFTIHYDKDFFDTKEETMQKSVEKYGVMPFWKSIFSESYEFVSSAHALIVLFKSGKVIDDLDFITKANDSIEKKLVEIASMLVDSSELFTLGDTQLKLLEVLKNDVGGVNKIKFINFLSAGFDGSERKNSNQKYLENLRESNLKNRISLEYKPAEGNKKVLGQFLGTIDSTIPLQLLTGEKSNAENLKSSAIPSKNAGEGTHYRPLTNCLSINLKNASGSFSTPFSFTEDTPDETGQFLFDPSEFGMGMAHLFYHEGGHALTEAVNTIFEILENEEETNESPVGLVVGKKNNDEESDTMRAAACMFSGDTTVKISSFIEELSKFWGMPARSDKAKYKGKTLQQIYADIRASREEWKKFPENLNDIPNFFERLIYLDKKISEGVKENGKYVEEKIFNSKNDKIDKGKIAKLLLSENREVMQILGFRIHNGVLYVNKFSDFALFAGQRLPVTMVHQNIYGAVKSQELSQKPIEEKLRLLLEHPTYFIEFKTKMNQKFLSALFSLYGDKMDSYMSDMEKRIEGGE